jgi:hypothetical protein
MLGSYQLRANENQQNFQQLFHKLNTGKIKHIFCMNHKKLRGLSLRANVYRQSDRRLSAKLVPIIVDRGFHVVKATDPYGRNLVFLDRSRYFFSQVAPQLYSRG